MTQQLINVTPRLLAGAVSLWATLGMVTFVAL